MPKRKNRYITTVVQANQYGSFRTTIPSRLAKKKKLESGDKLAWEEEDDGWKVKPGRSKFVEK